MCAEKDKPHPVFDEGTLARIYTGKYVSWARDLDQADLFALLWFVGEFACRSGEGKQFAKEQWPDHFKAGFSMRQHVAMDVLCQIYNGRRFKDYSIQSIREPLHKGMRTRHWDGQIIEHEN